MPYFPLVSVTFRRCPVTYGYAVLRSLAYRVDELHDEIDRRRRRHSAPFGKTMLSGCDSEKSRPLFVPEEQKQI
jgi:hypothetical protein